MSQAHTDLVAQFVSFLMQRIGWQDAWKRSKTMMDVKR